MCRLAIRVLIVISCIAIALVPVIMVARKHKPKRDTYNVIVCGRSHIATTEDHRRWRFDPPIGETVRMGYCG